MMLYTCDAYPRGALAPVTFLWQPETDQNRTDGSAGPKEEREVVKEGGTEGNSMLWLWSHPASYAAVWTQITHACALAPAADDAGDRITTLGQKDSGNGVLQSSEPKAVSRFGSPLGGTEVCAGALRVRSLKDQLVKFRLTGPASNLVLSETLKPVDITSAQASPQMNGVEAQESSFRLWWQKYYATEENSSHFLAQRACYERVMNCQSPGEIPPHAVLALTVRDPRVLLPSKRTKVDLHEAGEMRMDSTLVTFAVVCTVKAVESS